MSRRPFEAPSKARFATYCLVSLASVAIFRITPSGDTNCAMQLLWLASALITSIVVYTINDIANKYFTAYMDPELHPNYTAQMSAVLVLLGRLAIWVQTHGTIPPTDPASNANIQACIIHFAMSFWVLSETEFCLSYWVRHRCGRPSNDVDSLVGIWAKPTRDQSFKQSRDCFSYHYGDGWTLLEHTMTRAGVVDMLVFCLPFHFIGMTCLTYPIKRFANPALDEEIFRAMFWALYQPKNWFWSSVGIHLQRPIRLFNRMLFWSILDCVGSVWKGRTNTNLPTWG